jgi:hypothetical protein
LINLKRISRNHFLSEDEKTEIFVRQSGSKVREGKFSGGFKFSTQHGTMLPHETTYYISVNGDLRCSDVFEDEIPDQLRLLGYKINRQ